MLQEVIPAAPPVPLRVYLYPSAADLRELREGTVFWGFPHCVQNSDVTQAAIDYMSVNTITSVTSAAIIAVGVVTKLQATSLSMRRENQPRRSAPGLDSRQKPGLDADSCS